MPTLENSQIQRIEVSAGFTIPGLYRRLLVELGYGSVGRNAEIYHPQNVRSLYGAFFDDPTRLFNPFFPFGCDNDKQELWVIDAVAERAASIWHETHPDDWGEEEWLEYDEWVNRYLEPLISNA